MKLSTLRRPVAVLAVVLVLIGSPRPAFACGGVSWDAVFTRAEQPDSEADYLDGRLGVVLPGYMTRYLMVAYRYWIGRPLAREEQRMLRREPVLLGEGPPQDAVSVWLRAARSSTSPPIVNRIDTVRKVPGQEFEFYGNCPDDAFRTATATLERRTALAGATSPSVQDWVRAQQVVFSNCSAGSADPQPTPAGAPEWLRMDRSYQAAAARFYSERFDEAEKDFRAIAADPASPWRESAPYLAARCLVRRATLLAPQGHVDAATLGRAEEELRRIAGGDAPASIRLAANRLLGFVQFRLHPTKRREELARRLVSGSPDEGLWQDLEDYSLLLRRSPATAQESDLTVWLRNVQDRRPESLDSALRVWSERPSLPWLMSVLMRLPPTHARASEILQAAEQVDRRSPAWPTVAYHRARLLARRDEPKAARDLLDEILSQREALPISSVNMFLAERLRLAASFEEFLRDAPRVPAEPGWSYSAAELGRAVSEAQPLFDEDAAAAFNKGLPVRLWAEAAASAPLPAALRREIRLSAWTRAALLSDDGVALELAPALAQDLPELAGLFEEYSRAADAPARRFAAAFVLLHLPGAKSSVQRGLLRAKPPEKIDNVRENWWCPGGAASDYWTFAVLRSKEEVPARRPGIEPSIGFLTEAEQRQGAREAEEAARLDSAPNLLTREVLTWAKSHPDDPRVPEALYESVRVTRYGCTDEASGALSRKAFEALHRRYPASPWTKKTPYWFR